MPRKKTAILQDHPDESDSTDPNREDDQDHLESSSSWKPRMKPRQHYPELPEKTSPDRDELRKKTNPGSTTKHHPESEWKRGSKSAESTSREWKKYTEDGRYLREGSVPRKQWLDAE